METNIKYISKIEIEGLWDRYDIVWKLDPHVNILSGINGSGKTTILDNLARLLGSSSQNIRQKQNHKNFYIYFTGTNNEATAVYEERDERGERDERIKEVMDEMDKFYSSSGLYKKLGYKDNDAYEEAKISSDTSTQYGIYYESLALSILLFEDANLSRISTFDSPLLTSKAVQKLSNSKVQTNLDWEIYQLQKQYLSYQLKVSRRKDEVFETGKDIKQKVTQLRKPHQRFLEIIDSLFEETGKKVDRNENELMFLLANHKHLSPYELSAGEKQLVIILLTVLIQDNQSAVLVLDEPEISLHIDWQRKLIGYIRELNPNLQLILATHSPAIIMNGWLDKVTNISDIIVKDYQKD